MYVCIYARMSVCLHVCMYIWWSSIFLGISTPGWNGISTVASVWGDSEMWPCWVSITGGGLWGGKGLAHFQFTFCALYLCFKMEALSFLLLPPCLLPVAMLLLHSGAISQKTNVLFLKLPSIMVFYHTNRKSNYMCICNRGWMTLNPKSPFVHFSTKATQGLSSH